MIQMVNDETPRIQGATNESKTKIEQTVNNTVLFKETLFVFSINFPFLLFL